MFQSRLYSCGGDFLSPSLATLWQELAELPLLDGYGLSEAGPNVALNGPKDYQLGTVGKPLDGVTLHLDPFQELMIQSPSIMYDNWQLTNEYTASLAPTLATGDLARITDEGFVQIIGRKKNVIIINGHTIYPEQVESILRTFAPIHAVALVGISIYGRMRMAACVVSSDNSFKKEACLAWCMQQMPPEEIPHFFLQIGAIPVNANGKIDRLALSQWAKQQLSAFNNETAITPKKSEIID